jgi:hypothetical protein
MRTRSNDSVDLLEEKPMMKHARLLGIVAALGIWWLAGVGTAANNQAPGWKGVLDEADAKELIKRSTDLIEDQVKKPRANAKEGRKSNKRIQVAAVEIAALAQSAKAGADRQLLASIRDKALELAKEAGDKGNLNKMKMLAQALANPKVNAAAKPAAVNLKSFLDDQGDVMQAFKTVIKGGDGIEKSLQDDARLRTPSQNGIEEKVRKLARRKLTPAQLKNQAAELALLGDKIAALAQVNDEWVPEKKEGKRDPKDWLAWSKDMQTQALDLAAAARKGNANAVFMASTKLNATCNRCHFVFKPD